MVEGEITGVELLLPVGNLDMALAAIHHGADAIFLGVPGFNARGRSVDFEMSQLREIIELAHLYGVKVNLAFNILIFESEVGKVKELIRELVALKPDSFIVQDLGLVNLIRNMAPNMRIHGSTQMTVTCAEAIECLKDLKIQRFVLGRENSLADIKAIRALTSAELEVFVHGALCVSYSGQCFTSEGIGGRSANRGQCAQSCRFAYELFIDGEQTDLGDRAYLLSPQDLCGIEQVPALIEAGVNCFKVEGRLKTPEYVATAARAYRKAIEFRLNSHEIFNEQKNMAIQYSRGFYSGWLNGVNHQKLVDGTYGSHRGYYLGRIHSVAGNSFELLLEEPNNTENLSLEPGDGLLWVSVTSKQNRKDSDVSVKQFLEQGGFIYKVKILDKQKIFIEISDDIKMTADFLGSRVYQNNKKSLKKELTQKVVDKNIKRRVPIDVRLWLEQGQPLRTQIGSGSFEIFGESEALLEVANQHGVSDDNLKEQFGSLAGTVFSLNKFEVVRKCKQELFIPHGQIKKLRQKMVAELTEARRRGVEISRKLTIQNPQDQFLAKNKLLEDRELSGPRKSENSKPQFHLLLREKGQVEDLIGAIEEGRIDKNKLALVTLDFEFGRDYEPSLQVLRGKGLRVGLATTRVLKPNEYRNLKLLAQLNPDAVLIRNLGALYYFTQIHKITAHLLGDFSLNVTNHLTFKYLLSKGLHSICLSYDLNYIQTGDLLAACSSQQTEITIFQHMPSFHMEHCIFAAFLSNGSSFKDCGKPCERHQVELKDQFGNWHHIKADQECRNTMYSARSQSAAIYLEQWQRQGLGWIRFEALKDRGAKLIEKIHAHLEFLDGQDNSEDLLHQLKSSDKYGVSVGSLGRSQEYQSRKKTSPN